MTPTYDFHGQVALVTGASTGMGAATARAFAEAGAFVVLADINESAIGEELSQRGHVALPVDGGYTAQ